MPPPGRIARYALRSVWRLASIGVRVGLRRYVRAEPRELEEGERPRVFILLGNAWAMGGTIRASHNLAGHLAQSCDVELLSVMRRVTKPFFPFPPGVEVTALDDLTPAARARAKLSQRILRRLPSTLIDPADRAADACSLWSDLELVRRLREQSGFLIGTRPGFNLIAADLSPPGLIAVGQEHMHFGAHPRPLRRGMKRGYPKLAALAVLTERDLDDYGAVVGEAKLVRIPNAAEMGGPKADLEAPRILAAGRLTAQKGFDLLVSAFGQVAGAHPGWTLRICGDGLLRDDLDRLLTEAELGQRVELPGRCDLEQEMANASIFALSSRFEGFPVVLLEAMSKGMAVVSFDCPTGPAELIDDHRNGILVPAGDVDAFAGALRELMEDDELRGRCAAAGVKTASAYTVEAIGRRWEALLEELAEARGRAQRSP